MPSSFVLANISFQVTLGFEWYEDRAVASFVLFCPGIFSTFRHICASMNRWHRRRDAITKPHSGVYCTGLTGWAALCLLAWLPLSSSSHLFFLQFSFDQWPVKTPCSVEFCGGETRYVDFSIYQTALLPSKHERSLETGRELLKIQE